jgi:hypothetical protein
MTFELWRRDPLRATQVEYIPYAKCAACGKDLVGTYFVYDRMCDTCLDQCYRPVNAAKTRRKKRATSK